MTSVFIWMKFKKWDLSLNILQDIKGNVSDILQDNRQQIAYWQLD